MPPVVMTNVIATATIMRGAICLRMLRMFACVRNVSVISEKTMTMTAKKTAMLTTPPLSRAISLRRARQSPERGRSLSTGRAPLMRPLPGASSSRRRPTGTSGRR